MRRYLVIIIMTAVSCRHSEPVTFDKPVVEQEVREMLHAYHLDIRAQGLTAEFDYLDSSRDFFWIPPGYASPLSYDSVRSILRANALMFTKINFQWDTLSVYPLSDSIATYAGIVSGQMTDTAGNERVSGILESGTLIKRNGGWKLLSGQSVALQR